MRRCIAIRNGIFWRMRLLQRRRDILGLPQPVIAAEQAKTLDVEAGALFVADADMPTTQFTADEPTHVTMQRRGFFCVALDCDGQVKTRLRVHESGPCEPHTSDIQRLREATDIGHVTCSSGRAAVTGCGAKSIMLEAPVGEYGIAAFGLESGRSRECLLVISPAVVGTQQVVTETR